MRKIKKDSDGAKARNKGGGASDNKGRRRSSVETVRRYDSEEEVVDVTMKESPGGGDVATSSATHSRMSVAAWATEIMEEIGVQSFVELHDHVEKKFGAAAANDAKVMLRELHASMGQSRDAAEETSKEKNSEVAATKEKNTPPLKIIVWPSTIDAYKRVGDRIGRGSFAKVYKATCTCQLPSGEKSERIVAIKVIEAKSEGLLSRLGELQGELNAMTKCAHENILSLHQSFRHGVSSIVLVTPLMDLGSCSKIIRDIREVKSGINGLKEEWIGAILVQATRGLAYMHQCGFFHRDIKPANILVNSRGVVRIADLGLAAYTARKIDKKSTLNGTWAYMAPEIIMSATRNYTPKIDIWSLGITALELAVSYAPYAHLKPQVIVKRLYMGDVPSLLTYKEVHTSTGETLGTFSPAFHNFYKAMLMREPEKRDSAEKLLTSRFLQPWKKQDPTKVLREGLVAIIRPRDTGKKEDVPNAKDSLSAKSSKSGGSSAVVVKLGSVTGPKLDPAAAFLVDPSGATTLERQFSAVHRLKSKNSREKTFSEKSPMEKLVEGFNEKDDDQVKTERSDSVVIAASPVANTGTVIRESATIKERLVNEFSKDD